MMSDHIPKEIFVLVADHIKQNKKSLRQIKGFKNSGIEGWFKVETIIALREYVREARSKSPNLVLEVHENKVEIELVAATDFDPFTVKLGAIQQKTLCLFLGDASDAGKIKELTSDRDIEVVTHETFADNGNKWMIGLIRPSEEYLFHHQE